MLKNIKYNFTVKLKKNFKSKLVFVQAFHSLAKCVAAVTVPWENEAFIVVNKLMTEIQISTTDQQQIFSLLVIGEIGRHMLVYSHFFFFLLYVQMPQ